MAFDRADKFGPRRIHDYNWLRQSFMIVHGTQRDEKGDPSPEDVRTRSRYFTTAMFKFTDTTLGGNLVINPLPQFTRTADIRVEGLYNHSSGQGRLYSEIFDDNKRYITMSFGVPQFNSLTSFYKGFYDHDLALAARTGRSTDAFYTAGRVAGFIVGLMAPWLVLYSIASAFTRWATSRPTTKYYFMKQTMATYWNAVTSIANDIAVKTQLVSRVFQPPPNTGTDNRDVMNHDEVAAINRLLGEQGLLDSYNEQTGTGNGINVYAVATRAQRIQRRAMSVLEAYYKSGDAQGFANRASSTREDVIANHDALRAVRAYINDGNNNVRTPKVPFLEYLNKWVTEGPGVLPGGTPVKPDGSIFETDEAATTSMVEGNTTASSAFGEELKAEESITAKSAFVSERAITDMDDNETFDLTKALSKSASPKWYEFATAELDDGAQYVSFRVENTGEAGESFMNSTGEPEIATKINNISGSSRSTRFSMADGNVGDGVLGTIASTVVDATKSLATGAATSLGFSGLAVLGGNAFVDIPKTWTGSTFTASRMNYTIKLISPYGNRYSKFLNIWLPLSMLLAAATPLSTGNHSYTSPFLVQCFDRGRAQTRMGIIDSMSIRRGGGNLGWNKMGEPMMVQVDFSIVELSSIMHMPIQQSFGPIKGLFKSFDSESLYNDYMATLSSLSLAEQIYAFERFKIGLSKYLKNVDSYFSTAHAMNWLGDLGVSRLASAIFPGVTNR